MRRLCLRPEAWGRFRRDILADGNQIDQGENPEPDNNGANERQNPELGLDHCFLQTIEALDGLNAQNGCVPFLKIRNRQNLQPRFGNLLRRVGSQYIGFPGACLPPIFPVGAGSILAQRFGQFACHGTWATMLSLGLRPTCPSRLETG